MLVRNELGQEHDDLVLEGQRQGDEEEDEHEVGPDQLQRSLEGVRYRTVEEVDEGPDQGEQRPDDAPRYDQQDRGHCAEQNQDRFGHQQAAPGQGPEHVQDGLRRLVALHRADQALEHAGIEGQPQCRGAEEDGPDERPDAQVVDGDLGVEGALNRVEPEDHQAGHNHPGRLHAGGAPGDRNQLQGVEVVPRSVARAHAGFPPSPTNSNSRWPGSNGAAAPSRR